MELHLIEVKCGPNWGKFAIGRPGDKEWSWRTKVESAHLPLLRMLGWDWEHLWVFDLNTGEGAMFRPSGSAKMEITKHPITSSPALEPFLEWLFKQELESLDDLPESIDINV